MEIKTIIKTSNCYCRVFEIRASDKIVNEQPENTFVVHKCPLIDVFQLKGGFKRFYNFKEKEKLSNNPIQGSDRGANFIPPTQVIH